MRRSPLDCRQLGLAAALVCMASPAWAHAPGLDKELPALAEYFRLGVEHILTGFDHLAFLIGLIVLAGSTRALLLAVTAFTLAHSLSLALAMFGVVAPSPLWVEVAIAVSIAYVGFENFLLRDASSRWRITLLFGFVHGFGFAGALREIGVPQERAPAALALFNLGVESGQLMVLALVVPALRWLRSRPAVWVVAARALNGALVVIGLGWAVQRGLGAIAAAPVEAQRAQAAPLIAAAQREGSALVSVYAHDPPRSETAARLCDLFARLPRERRAACAGSAPGVSLERECTRVLSAALASGALRVDRPAADGCEDALRGRYADCGFASLEVVPAIESCTNLWLGRIAQGGSCRSALECQSGLICSGVGPFDAGVCSAPKRAGASCGRSTDVLAAYLPHREADHPECAGSCARGRCRD
jgi:hydrogenase/urease accessory protein HupE